MLLSTVLVRTLRVTLVLTMSLGGMLATGTAASAHSYLVSSAPADQESFATAPPAVVLTFNEAVSTDFSEIVVTGPDGSTFQTGAPAVSGATVTQSLGLLRTPGGYDVAWRVVSADGHPITGVLTFTVTATAPATAPATVDPTTTAPAPTTGAGQTTATESTTAAAVVQDVDTASSDGGARPLILGLAIAVLALGAGAFALSRRRQAGGHD